MTYDEIRDYYDEFRFGNHINTFSTLHVYARCLPLGGYELRAQVFHESSPMRVGTAPADPTVSSIWEQRFRVMMYYVNKSVSRKLLEHVENTRSKRTQYRITQAGRDYVESGLQERLNYLSAFPEISLESACRQIETAYANSYRNFSRAALERRKQSENSSKANLLQLCWGIRHHESESTLSKVRVSRHLLLSGAEAEMVESTELELNSLS